MNPYQPPETPTEKPSSRSSPETFSLRGFLAFVVVGAIGGITVFSDTRFPASSHPLREYRGVALGTLIGILLYFLVAYFHPGDEE